MFEKEGDGETKPMADKEPGEAKPMAAQVDRKLDAGERGHAGRVGDFVAEGNAIEDKAIGDKAQKSSNGGIKAISEARHIFWATGWFKVKLEGPTNGSSNGPFNNGVGGTLAAKSIRGGEVGLGVVETPADMADATNGVAEM
jgi:hypothetical protein